MERENLLAALRQVRSNKGGSGIDGMSVEQLPDYLRLHWLEIRAQLLSGAYRPSPVRRVLIPKPGGGIRVLGVPTVLDRFIQQALLQVLQRQWDQTFSHWSFGFRPKRSAHQAVACAQGYLRAGYRWVVDLDLEKFFDTVNHDVLMHRVSRRVEDDRVLTLIRRFLKSGVSIAMKTKARHLTQRTRGQSLHQIIAELRTTLLGWKAYFGFAEVNSPLTEIDKWIRRKLRCNQWKQWGRRGYRALRELGVSRELAWNTAKSAHGPWRLSRSPALAYALTQAYFTRLGLPILARS